MLLQDQELYITRSRSEALKHTYFDCGSRYINNFFGEYLLGIDYIKTL